MLTSSREACEPFSSAALPEAPDSVRAHYQRCDPRSSIPTKQGSEIELRGYCVKCSLTLEVVGSGRDVKVGIATDKIKTEVQAVQGLDQR